MLKVYFKKTDLFCAYEEVIEGYTLVVDKMRERKFVSFERDGPLKTLIYDVKKKSFERRTIYFEEVAFGLYETLVYDEDRKEFIIKRTQTF